MDLYNLVISAKLSKGEGGDVSVDPLSVTENGTYTASSGHAYSPVTVNVPNSYAASDEGKVVSNGALVGQTSATKTANGTYDTTLNDEIVVNVPTVTPTGNINITSTAQTDVSAYATAQVVDADLVASNIKKDVDILGVVGTYEGGGGGSSWTLLHEEDIEVHYSGTSATTVKSVDIPGIYSDNFYVVRVYDKAGPRTGHFFQSFCFIANAMAASGGSIAFTGIPKLIIAVDSSNKWQSLNHNSSIYANDVYNDKINIYAKYNSSTGTLDGTYRLEIYKLTLPDGSSSPFPTV